ncbi:MAG: hypothetical protein C0483_11430 [Pirellula sp.]|nr:hypothetical protein [Pirellula sp.]
MPLIRTLFIWGVAACALGGVLRAADPKGQATVVVVGDGSAAAVLAELRRAGVTATDDQAAILGAELVVVAQNAGDGVLPLHRELLKEVSRAGRLNILWIITDSQKVDDWELLALEQMEARELLTAHGLPGDAATFAVDKASGATPSKGIWLIGWKAIGEFAAQHEK